MKKKKNLDAKHSGFSNFEANTFLKKFVKDELYRGNKSQ